MGPLVSLWAAGFNGQTDLGTMTAVTGLLHTSGIRSLRSARPGRFECGPHFQLRSPLEGEEWSRSHPSRPLPVAPPRQKDAVHQLTTNSLWSLSPSPFEGREGPAPLGWGSGQGTPLLTPPGGGRCGALELTALLQAQSCREARQGLLGSGSCRKITPVA